MVKNKWEKTLVVDIDGTLCFHNRNGNTTEERYGKATPNASVIEALREAYVDGFYIILHTSRRMWTHKGDAKAAEADAFEVTRKWLSDNVVPFDELIFGKPFAAHGYYIDDKAMTPEDFVEFMSVNQVGLAQEIAREWLSDIPRRSGGTAYTHARNVAALVRTDFEKSLAWLHDVVEDTECTLAMLRTAGVSVKIIAGVQALTHLTYGTSYDNYINKVIRHVSLSNGAIPRVKLADNLDNLTSDPTFKQVHKYLKSMKKLKDALVRHYGSIT